ncbi:hypothetical protein HRI_005236300 [Hibiscus trionum]|uniref:PPPDE domain-containing protein n=1 Tax=Hibiscus trionum TaxID=183268 RepID=A0A9W7MXX3_HIBTR|nr:hypothetical protein HRI_005236300 [Hibiscus trionum]
MGKVSNPSHGESNSTETKVVLHVYDLTHINNYSYWFGFGVFHSGIEVHGKEYGFGAHEFPVTGVFEVEPKNCPGFAYRRSILLGTVNITSSEFRSFIETMASQYYGNSYNLISKNCNHFADDVARKLTGKRIPGWVNRLARLGALFSCILPRSLHVTKVKKVLETGTLPVPRSLLFKNSIHLQFTQLGIYQLRYHAPILILSSSYFPENGSETPSTATPTATGSSETDNKEENKFLLSPKAGSSDINLVMEAQSDCREL